MLIKYFISITEYIFNFDMSSHVGISPDKFNPIQIAILRLMGFTPLWNGIPFQRLSVGQKIISVALYSVSGAILLGTFFYTLLRLLEICIIGSAAISLVNTDKDGLLNVLRFAPNAAVSLRCFAILVVFFIKRHSFLRLANQVGNRFFGGTF